MAKWEQDRTLFRPDTKAPMGGGGGGRKGGAPQMQQRAAAPAQDDEEPQIGLGDRISEALRSAKRRPILTLFMLILGTALTVVAAMYAPRSYECEAQILITRTTAIGGAAAMNFPQTGDERKELAKEYEQQILARDNIIQIVQQTRLVDRWNELQPPHRRIMAQLGAKLGQPQPTDDQKFEALVRTIEAKLRVEVDATTVVLRMEWSEPRSSMDIVKVAVENFQKKRFEVEVGVVPESVRAFQGKVDEKRKEVGRLFKEMSDADAKRHPGTGPTRFVAREVANGEPATGDPVILKRMEIVKQDIATREETKRNRITDLQHKLSDMSSTYAPGHPEVVALKAQLAATQADPPELGSLREQERRLQQEYDASKVRDKKTVMVGVVDTAAPPAPTTPRSVEDLKGMYDIAARQLGDLQFELERKRIDQQTTELAFKNRYSVTKPPEFPGGPKKPVGLMAGGIGMFLTIALALMAAALRDRFSGVFFEPRDVRDRLGLPVYATMKW